MSFSPSGSWTFSVGVSITVLVNTSFPNVSKQSSPSTQQPWITFSYCTYLPNYEHFIKGEGMGSLCFMDRAGRITHCHTAAWQDQTQSRTVPPVVSQERKPACTEAEELGSSLLTMPAIQSTAHSATMRPSLYSTLSWALGIILLSGQWNQQGKVPQKYSRHSMVKIRNKISPPG